MRGRLHARLDRLERGTPAAAALGAEVMRLVDQYVAEGGDLAELLPIFDLGEETEEEGGW